jgi:hypothetical protein
MIINWPTTKDELYGPPPAYSITNNYENPPSSIYIIPETRIEYQERPSSHVSIILSLKFLRYLLGTGLIHILIGLVAIVCDMILTTMNEWYLFTGIWTGVLCIILGIYLILFTRHPKKQICSLQRFRFIHMIICLITILALILSSIHLASDSCYKPYLEVDECQQLAYKLKIILVTFFTFTFVQICVTLLVTFVHTR